MRQRRESISHPPGCAGFSRLVGESESISSLRSLIETIGRRSCTVLIQGESGTGKELVARHVHAAGDRVHGPFVTVDCTTLQGTLLESQLFGHVKGAFTGAEQETLGFFRAADGGTLLLDEVGELHPRVQAKLLRCIQDRAVVPLGSVKPIPADVRIIAATHRNLKEMVRHGEFREDLYYRLDVVRLEVSPLRARKDDIIRLAEHFLQEQSRFYQEPVKRLPPDTCVTLKAYAWPGNVRELANAMEHAHIMCQGDQVVVGDLPEALRSRVAPVDVLDSGDIVPLEVAERRLVERALHAARGHQAQAAQMLQIERRRLYRKVRRYGLQSLVARTRQ